MDVRRIAAGDDGIINTELTHYQKSKAECRKEEAFVFGKADKAEQETSRTPKAKPERTEKRDRPKPAEPKPEAKEQREGKEPTTPTPAPIGTPAYTGRVPLTTRIRSDLATALKRASLERQLANEKPNTVQDILEEALDPWLKAKGFLKG